MSRPLALAVLLAAGGCATPVPTVDYRPLAAAPRDGGGVPYQLTDSRLVIGVVPAGSGSDKDAPPVSLDPVTVDCPDGDSCTVAGKPVRLGLAVVPIAFAGEVLAISPKRRGLITTNLAPTYYPNSLRLQALSVEAKDHRIEVINAVGTIARTVAKVAASGAMAFDGGGDGRPAVPQLHLPIVLNLAFAKAAQKDFPAAKTRLTDYPRLPSEANQAWSVVAGFLDDPAPAALGFVPRAQAPGIHHGIVTSVCRPLRLSLVADSTSVDFVATVADPDWLVAIPFPAKGSVTLHPLCGADVQAQAVTEIGVDTLATAFATDVAAVAAAAR